jgi:hypothetical protein
MNVAELIVKLQAFPADALVRVSIEADPVSLADDAHPPRIVGALIAEVTDVELHAFAHECVYLVSRKP